MHSYSVLLLLQERYLGVANAFEGTVFVSPEYAANKTLSDYVAEIFPTFKEVQINATTSLYNNISTLGTAGDRMGAVLGECASSCRIAYARSI